MFLQASYIFRLKFIPLHGLSRENWFVIRILITILYSCIYSDIIFNPYKGAIHLR